MRTKFHTREVLRPLKLSWENTDKFINGLIGYLIKNQRELEFTDYITALGILGYTEIIVPKSDETAEADSEFRNEFEEEMIPRLTLEGFSEGSEFWWCRANHHNPRKANKPREKSDNDVLIAIDVNDKCKYQGFPSSYYWRAFPDSRLHYFRGGRLVAVSDILNLLEEHKDSLMAALKVGTDARREEVRLKVEAIQNDLHLTESEKEFRIERRQSRLFPEVSWEELKYTWADQLMTRTNKYEAYFVISFTKERVKEILFDVYQEALNIRLLEEYEQGISSDYARAFQTKKNLTQKVQKAMATSPFLSLGFREVEYDVDVDLTEIPKLALTWQGIRPFLPVSKEEAVLRFRKLGNHKASGLYFSRFTCIAVDLRSIDSFVHEYGHHLDYTIADEMLSQQPDFAPLLKAYMKELYADEYVSPKDKNYFMASTEVFARAFELWVSKYKISNYQLVKSIEEYERQREYLPLLERLDFIKDYFDKLLAKYPFTGDREPLKSIKNGVNLEKPIKTIHAISLKHIQDGLYFIAFHNLGIKDEAYVFVGFGFEPEDTGYITEGSLTKKFQALSDKSIHTFESLLRKELFPVKKLFLIKGLGAGYDLQKRLGYLEERADEAIKSKGSIELGGTRIVFK